MKPISNWPGYFGDKYGSVHSTKFGKLRKLKTYKDSHGYHNIVLCHIGKKHHKRVGRLMLETFVGPCPSGMECCHGYRGKSDDSLKNLSWGKKSKNCSEDRVRDGTDSRGEKNGRAKLNRKQVIKIRSLAGEMTQEEIAKKFGVHQTQIGFIVRRKKWDWLNV